jgi:D-glycero-alpha-D-manno-heptose-7-phosphate kinase
MILARTPLRITLGGGGTDLPAFTDHQTGFTLTATIDKYVYALITENFSGQLWLKYSKIEHVTTTDQITHPLLRAIFSRHPSHAIELTTSADIPAGTGLGSSAAFTLSVLAALRTHRREDFDPNMLAAEAALIEMVDLGDPVGTQDQYACGVGGLLATHHHANGTVITQHLDMPIGLEHLLLFYTGHTHDTRQVLSNPPTYEALKTARSLGGESYLALTDHNMTAFAQLLTRQWKAKLARSMSPLHRKIHRWINGALDHGALGAKLVGAGEGGFILAYATDPLLLRDYMRKEGLREVRFAFTHHGTELL